MKNLLFISIVVLAGCSMGGGRNGEMPEDLDQLTELRDAKNAEIRKLQSEVGKISTKINALNPNREVSGKLVTTLQVERKDFKRFARVQGVLQSDANATVASEMGGRLTSVRVDEGDYVRRGQLLATIDTVSMVKTRYELEKQLELAQDIYERQKRLWDQNIGSEIQYLQAKNGVERFETSIATLEHNLTKAWIYSPLAGVIDYVNLKPGQLAQPGVPIVTILDTRNVKVVADVPENYLGKVARGEQVDVYFPALDEHITAPITMIGRKIDPANRTFIIEIRMKSDGALYKPNLLAEVMINDYVETAVIVLSQELIQQEVGGRNFVMVVRESDDGLVARKTYITTGAGFEGDVVVSDGLKEGEVVILSGSRGLVDSERIEIQSTQDSTDGE